MSRAFLALLLLAGPVLAAGEAPTVRVEVDAPEATWVGVPVPATVRVVLDLEAFEAAAVKLFPRTMDLQLKLTVPWVGERPTAPAAGGEALSLVLNDQVVALRRVADRDGLAVLEAEWTVRPEKAGPLELPAPTFEFAYATEFEDDFVSGRRPLDRHPVKGAGEARTVEVHALPVEGRPAAFSGAVGRFTVRASAAPTTLAVGEELALTLRIAGEGNLARFDTPAPGELDGFHVLGRIDDRATPERTIVYHLSPVRGGIAAVPAVAFPFFDPAAGAYRTVTTAPIPLVVRSDAGRPPARDVPEEGVGFPWPIVAGAAVGLVLLALLLLRARRRPAEPLPPTPAEVFAGAAEADLTAAFTNYLAARLHCAPAAVISPDLARRLEAVGVPAELAERAGALVAELVGARYGGEAGGDELRMAVELVEELEAAS